SLGPLNRVSQSDTRIEDLNKRGPGKLRVGYEIRCETYLLGSRVINRRNRWEVVARVADQERINKGRPDGIGVSRDVTVSVSQVDRAKSGSVCPQKRERIERRTLKVVCNKTGLLFIGNCLVQPASYIVIVGGLVALDACAARCIGIRQEVQI